MADVQLALIDEQQTEITLAVPGIQGAAGAGVPAAGTQNQLLVKQSGVDYDTAWSDNIDVPGTLDVTGDATFDQDVTIEGDLTVNGTTTTIETETLIVEDKNIEMGAVATPTDVTADGGGITLKGTTDKTINWIDATDSWTSSEHLNLVTGKSYRIAGTEVLSATALGSAVQISSANIPSGTIVNDDVNAAAAIAGTKVSPNFGSQTIATTGSITGGANAAPVILTDTTGVTGADQVTNIISLTQAEYDAIVSPNASTFYVITA